MDKLVIKFPKQHVELVMSLTCTTMNCNGIQYIKNFYKQLNDHILAYDSKANLSFTIQSMPTCNLTIKSDFITLTNSITYFNLIKDFIELFNCKDINVSIVSCNSCTSNNVKKNLLTSDLPSISDEEKVD